MNIVLVTNRHNGGKTNGNTNHTFTLENKFDGTEKE